MPATDVASGRANQKLRTRQALVSAVRSLLAEGRNPTLDDVAEAALVSRATAYRYFPSVEALVAEAAIEGAMADASTIAMHDDLLDRVLAAVHGANAPLLDNEVAMHVMARSLADRWLAADGDERATRPGRRMQLIDAALEPYAADLGPAVTARLRSALAFVAGMEAVLSARDVLGLGRDEAAEAFTWAATALVTGAQAEAAASTKRRPPPSGTGARTRAARGRRAGRQPPGDP